LNNIYTEPTHDCMPARARAALNAGELGRTLNENMLSVCSGLGANAL